MARGARGKSSTGGEHGEVRRSGFVAVVGRPNVGKSTLVNALVRRKVSIVSPRVQTTRHQIRGILTDGGVQAVFVDTPGVHRPRTPMGARLNSASRDALRDPDVVLFVVDAVGGIGTGDQRMAATMPKDAIIVLNRCDRVSRERVAQQLVAAAALAADAGLARAEFFPTSALRGRGVDPLREEVLGRLPEGPAWFAPDEVHDVGEGFWVAELVREQLLEVAREELPHSIATRCVELDFPLYRVEILVERESQKGMVIGRAGENLKRAGIAVRRQLPEGSHLELEVKVAKDWQRDDRVLDRLGY